MLILTRKPSQKIVINDDIVIEVLDISGQHIRLGIKAPESVRIEREERYKSKEVEAHG